MGKKFEILEIMLVCHGSSHNDTICMAEEYRPCDEPLFQLVTKEAGEDL